CAGSALVTACLAVEPDAFRAAVAALVIIGVAGELAAEKSAGPGSFAVAIIDALHNLDGHQVTLARDKHGSTRAMIAETRDLRAVLEPEGIPLLVNDRVDVALAAEADGVHIGQDDIAVPDARLLLGRRAIIGLSVKTVEQAKAAPLELLDYVAIGGVYGTTSKENARAPIGTDGLRSIVNAVRLRKANFPICAIAGITAENAADVIAAGADGVAVISALSLAADPAKAAQ